MHSTFNKIAADTLSGQNGPLFKMNSSKSGFNAHTHTHTKKV